MARTVLIVDDSARFRRIARAVIEDAGLSVIAEAADAGSAIALAAAAQPDVILLDVSLPDGSGLAAVDPILDVAPATRIIIISARSASELGEALATSRAASFFPKERFSARALLEVLGGTA
jgi:DNA-binding NarL/FixJ family response regulator